MPKNNNKKLYSNKVNRFKFRDDRYFLDFLSKYPANNMPKEIKKYEKQLKKYPHIYKNGGRPAKALAGLKFFSWFLRPPKAGFKLETALEGLVLIFLLDEMADNNKLSASYRKKFLYEFDVFIKNISLEAKIGAKDVRQKEMQEIWLNFFQKIYRRPGLKPEKWIKATRGFIQGMANELENKKYRSMNEYLNNAVPSSGAVFYWQSIIAESGRARQNNARYDKLCGQIAKILRLTNDSARIKEDKNKITALNFCRGKNELKIVIEKELEKFRSLLKISGSINKQIRVAMWRSAIFLYYFYQKGNF